MGRRLIEVSFPIKEVSDEALREKSIRHGHISTLHIWWARRPLAAMRAATYAALVDEEQGAKGKEHGGQTFIAKLSNWENSLNRQLLDKARKDILEANGEKPPKVLDCFAGGGSIPLEALRLGCETYALEYNPVAVLVLKATVELPMRFGQKLLDEVKRWGEWVLKEARKELDEFYPVDDDGSVPVGYIWARTIPCQNPSCGAEIPLMRQFWLAKKPKRQIALMPIVDKERRQVEFMIVERGKNGVWTHGQRGERGEGHAHSSIHSFDPSKGTVRRAHATCLVCNTTVPDKRVRELFREGKSGQRMVAVVTHKPGEQGKRYRLPTKQDLKAFQKAEEALEAKIAVLREKWGMEPVPDEPLPPIGTLGFRIQRYGMTTWGDLFNARQKLALLTFAEKVREAYGALTTSPSPEASGEESEGWREGRSKEEREVGPAMRFERPSRELIQRARELRRQQTAAEALLWELLRNRQLLGRKFRRQHPIGRFITDFFCDDANLIIEIDGAVHQEPSQQERDRAREEVIREHGYHLLRFTNEQVIHQTEQVLQTIADFVQTHSFENPSPSASPPPALSERELKVQAAPVVAQEQERELKVQAAPPLPEPWERGTGGEGANLQFAKAVATYLALAVSRLSDRNSALCRVIVQTEAIGFTFARQALPMLWDYIEMAPLSHPSGWESIWADFENNVAHLIQIPNAKSLFSTVQQGTATALPYPDKFFDAVITDPPYYDNVPYSDLSDFFYVWLKRSIGELYPDLFMTPLTPKTDELVADTVRRGGSMEAARKWFEENLTQAFREIARVLKDNGIAVIVFAHKSVEAWDAVITALLNAGLMMTASWAVKMEMEARLRSQASAALLSSVLMVCRKRTANEIGDYPKVLSELREKVSERLESFWKAGLKGADFFMSAIGPAVEVFGRYERVEKPTGEPATVAELLSEVRRIVAEDALKHILHNPDLSEIDPASRFYLLWRWTFNGAKAQEQAELPTDETETGSEEEDEQEETKRQKTRVPKVPYDDARLIAQAIVGAEGVERRDWEQWRFVRVERGSKGATVQVLPADERKDEDFRSQSFDTMIDALHFACRLWSSRNYNALQKHLAQTYGGRDAFWRYAQSLSEILPEGDKERQWLHGLLVWQGTAFQKQEQLKQLTLPYGGDQ